MVYPLSYNKCRKQFISSTVTRFRFRFNQYKSNIKSHGEGRRSFKQENLIIQFFCDNHGGTHRDIKQLITATQMIKKEEKIFGYIIWNQGYLKD